MLPQIDRILFPTDFSACAEGAYRHAALLADRLDAELHILHVVRDGSVPERAWPGAPGTGSVDLTMGDVYLDLGLPAPPEPETHFTDLIEIIETEVAAPNVVNAILDASDDEAVGLVVIGTHGRTGWRRGVLGSVAEAVARRAPCPVLTVRPLDAPGREIWPPHSIVLGVDAEAYAEDDVIPDAARWAARLASAYGARLEIASGVKTSTVLAGAAEAALERDRLRGRLLDLGEALRDETKAPLGFGVHVRTGDPAREVEGIADEIGAHLVVVGSHARRGVGRILLGSIAEDLIRAAPCPVLVVRDALAPGWSLALLTNGATTS